MSDRLPGEDLDHLRTTESNVLQNELVERLLLACASFGAAGLSDEFVDECLILAGVRLALGRDVV